LLHALAFAAMQRERRSERKAFRSDTKWCGAHSTTPTWPQLSPGVAPAPLAKARFSRRVEGLRATLRELCEAWRRQ
jgi:hypothetical protein